MGCTRYRYLGSRVPGARMAAVAAGLQILRPRPGRETGVRLAGGLGEGGAETTGQRRFNGPKDCGHAGEMHCCGKPHCTDDDRGECDCHQGRKRGGGGAAAA